jgi:hypothetical protein
MAERCTSRTFRILVVLGGAVAAVGLLAAPASAAPGKGNAKGFLILDNNGVVTALAPGQAVKQADAACVGGVNVVAASVDAARAAFPAAFAVCDGVTLTSQVAAEVDEVDEA